VAEIPGCDYSFARPDPACLARNGIRFAVRYTSIGPSGKNLSPAEAGRLIAAGLQVVVVFEEAAGHMLLGRAAGAEAASASWALAHACGMPDDRPHYFALDVDPRGFTAGQWAAVEAYLDGAAGLLGRERVGVYGAYAAIERLCQRFAPWGWQTYAWSAGRVSGKAHLYQYQNGQQLCGGTVDLTRALADDYGGWPTQGGGDVPLTEAEWTRLQGLIDARADTTEASLKAKVDQVTGLLFRGDPDTLDGGTHKDNLKAIRAGVLDFGNQLAEHGDLSLSDAQLERLAAQVAARMQIAGTPSFAITGEAVPKEGT
jgi:Domain of unknown function (DUF1906)